MVNAYDDILKTVVSYATNLLIVQYHDKPKARKTINLLATLLWCNMVLMQIRDGFDWRTAVGKQLDILGKWLGVDRFYNGQLYYYKPWFTLLDWNSNGDNLQYGFSEFDNFDTVQPQGGFLNYQQLLTTDNVLSDYAFQMMLGLKIIKNSISATAKNIDEAIYKIFGGEVYTVWSDHTLTYYYSQRAVEIIEVAYTKNVLPCPTGVKIELKEFM